MHYFFIACDVVPLNGGLHHLTSHPRLNLIRLLHVQKLVSYLKLSQTAVQVTLNLPVTLTKKYYCTEVVGYCTIVGYIKCCFIYKHLLVLSCLPIYLSSLIQIVNASVTTRYVLGIEVLQRTQVCRKLSYDTQQREFAAATCGHALVSQNIDLYSKLLKTVDG